MIQQLVGRITEDEMSEIKEIILEQGRKFSQVVEITERQKLFSDEYKSHHRASSLSWAVYSGFLEGIKIGNFNVAPYRYGKNHVRPKLENEKIILFIMNSMDPDAKYLKNFYRMNEDLENEKVYAYIKFFAERKHWTITNIGIYLPDKNGRTISKENMYQKPKLKVLGA